MQEPGCCRMRAQAGEVVWLPRVPQLVSELGCNLHSNLGFPFPLTHVSEAPRVQPTALCIHSITRGPAGRQALKMLW